MRPTDSKAFGRRVRELREELGLSQTDLAIATGLSQSQIGWIENGGPKKPQRLASELAEALGSTRDYLLWSEGPRRIGPTYLSTRQIIEKYEALSPEFKAEISQVIENVNKLKKRKKFG